jgi:hypothetical protein
MNRRWIMAGLVISGGAIGCSGARADLKYTTEMRMGATGGQPMHTMTTMVKKNARRMETTQRIGSAQTRTISLTLCDKKQEIRLDPAQKIYTVAPLGGAVGNGASATSGGSEGRSGTGKIVNTSSIKFLGEETIAGTKTRHYLVKNRMQTSGCAGNTDLTSQMEIWVAPGLKEPGGCQEGMDPAQAMASAFGGCKVTFVQQGDAAAYRKAYNGLVLRMKMVGEGGRPGMTQQVSALSRAPLSTSLFTIPAGYKKVSAQEFQQAQTKAMMEAMSGGSQQ